MKAILKIADDKSPAAQAIRLMGGQTKAGKLLGLSPQNVHSWRKNGIPDRYLFKVAEATGLDLHFLRRPIKRYE